MPSKERTMPTELFIELWNQIGDLGQIARRCGRSKASVVARAEQLASVGFDLRKIDGATKAKTNIYLPSQETIRKACLEIRAKKAKIKLAEGRGSCT